MVLKPLYYLRGVVCLLCAAFTLAGCRLPEFPDSGNPAFTAEKRVSAGPRCKKNSECLLAYGVDADHYDSKDVRTAVLKVGNAEPVMDLEEENTAEIGPLSELELFLARHEPNLDLDVVKSAPPMPARKAKAKSSGAPAKPAPLRRQKTGTDLPAIQAFRMGEHSSYTRIVLDMDAAASARIAFDEENEKLLIVDLPGLRWAAEEKWFSDQPPLVSAYLAKPLARGGTRLIVNIKENAAISSQFSLPPDGNHQWHRLIIDLKGKTVHG
jgi:hypothetical protein